MESEKAEVLRYLDHRNQEISPELDALVDECMHAMRQAAEPRHVLRTFKIRFVSEGILLDNTELILLGADIARHLAGCEKVILLAATLGVTADSLIRRWESADLTRSLVLDACATQLIERHCDELEARVCREAEESGLLITSRFSPGYGDMSLDVQTKFLAVLDTGRKIGLTCTESLILLPRKSVTAFIGLGEHLPEKSKGCENCSLNHTCGFRKGKNHYEYI